MVKFLIMVSLISLIMGCTNVNDKEVTEEQNIITEEQREQLEEENITNKDILISLADEVDNIIFRSTVKRKFISADIVESLEREEQNLFNKLEVFNPQNDIERKAKEHLIKALSNKDTLHLNIAKDYINKLSID